MLLPYAIAKDMFEEVFDSAFANCNLGGLMNTDIKENDQGYELVIDLPSVKKENLSAELKDGYLVISAAKGLDKDEKEKETGKFVRQERYAGSMSRSFYIGENVKEDDIHAKYESGVLKINIPKEEAKEPEAEKKKYIAIEG